ncbi:MAG: HupE/UreJ family protein, partial [Pseudomonadota bacterium]
LLSGIGHPILGFDHLFFIIAVGIAAVFTGRALNAPLGYLIGMTAGCVLIMSGVGLPAVELVIALSLLIGGAVLMTGRGLSLLVAMGLFGVLGLFHGWAFGESITGQESAASAGVIAGYLIGLIAAQYAIAVAAGWVAKTVWGAATADAVPARLAGGMVAGVGAFLVLEVAEGAAFAALGLG